MDLQISVFLLFILFTAGHSLSCYDCIGLMGSCADQKVTTCGSGSQCMSSTKVIQFCDTLTTVKVKGCASPNDCKMYSFNFGKAKISSSCCDTELCNGQEPPDFSPNGTKCYYCDENNCLNIVKCSRIEDHCITATGRFGAHSMFVKGCVSEAICNGKTSDPNVKDISCCEGDLCNGSESGAKSVNQSFLFLSCSLLSFIFLH